MRLTLWTTTPTRATSGFTTVSYTHLLERFETETDLNRNDVFYGVFQLIMKSKDEDITLGKIANLME